MGEISYKFNYRHLFVCSYSDENTKGYFFSNIGLKQKCYFLGRHTRATCKALLSCCLSCSLGIFFLPLPNRWQEKKELAATFQRNFRFWSFIPPHIISVKNFERPSFPSSYFQGNFIFKTIQELWYPGTSVPYSKSVVDISSPVASGFILNEGEGTLMQSVGHLDGKYFSTPHQGCDDRRGTTFTFIGVSGSRIIIPDAYFRGICVSEHTSKRTSRRMVARMAFICTMAMRVPMQPRGPCPKVWTV